jgi:lipopolysaccharide/colanic/teichoic acid biosynthesis glycosyltransferase
MKSFFSIIFRIFLNKLSWVSYLNSTNELLQGLPIIKPGIFSPEIINSNVINAAQSIFEINLNYAKNYQIKNDLIIIFKALKKDLNLQYHIERKKQLTNGTN